MEKLCLHHLPRPAQLWAHRTPVRHPSLEPLGIVGWGRPWNSAQKLACGHHPTPGSPSVLLLFHVARPSLMTGSAFLRKCPGSSGVATMFQTTGTFSSTLIEWISARRASEIKEQSFQNSPPSKVTPETPAQERSHSLPSMVLHIQVCGLT